MVVTVGVYLRSRSPSLARYVVDVSLTVAAPKVSQDRFAAGDLDPGAGDVAGFLRDQQYVAPDR
jgi:hypothetical protein